MIAQIDEPISSFNGVFGYHETKVSSGVASRLGGNLFTDTPAKFSKEMKEVASLNPNVKNICKHISLNLPHGETLPDSRFMEMANRYMQEMGYSNCPFYAYKHTDREHLHVHLVISTVDFDGKWVNNSFEHDRSFRVSRKLEREFGLSHPKPKEEHRTFSLSEKALQQFSFQRALKRALYDPKAVPFLEESLSASERFAIKSKTPLSNDEIRSMLGEERFTTLNSYLMFKGYATKYLKEVLEEKLDRALQSPSRDDYMKALHQDGVEVSLFSSKGRNEYRYTLTDYDFTFKENRLPKNFSYGAISERFGSYKGTYIPPTEQKHILYSAFALSLSQAENLSELKSILAQAGINFSVSANAGNAQAQLSIAGPENALPFSSEELNKKFTYGFIQHALYNNAVESIPEVVSKSIYAHMHSNYPQHTPTPFAPDRSMNQHQGQEDDRNLFRKKRKKGEERDLDNGREME